VEEQSHKDEMRAALRGDFERLHARLETGGEAAERRPSEGTVPAGSVTVARIQERPSWLARLLTKR
jgi:hypothetical protein